MTFDRPLLLVLAAVLPLAAAALAVLGARRRRARLARLGGGAAVQRLLPPSARASAWPRAVRIGGALALAAVALAGPRWGAEQGVVRGEGVDVVLALDASNSMLAADERPSRLERMKQEVRRLRSLSPGDRVALIAFAGRSYILTPLTVDDGALELFLDNLDPSVVGQTGSSLSRAISQSTDLLLSTRSSSDRAVVLMSDGEAFELPTEIEEAARRAKEEGITIVTVGFGTPQGGTIPEPQPNGGVAPKRDRDGNVVVTRYSPDLLRAAAEAAGGTFIDAAQTDKAARIRSALSGLRAQQRATQMAKSLRPRFQLFLFPAFLLLALDALLVARSRRRGTRAIAGAAPASAAAAAALVVALAVPRTAGAVDPIVDAARAYRARQYARAAALYRQAVSKGDRSPTTLYNLGTALLAADSLGAALEPLERAAATGQGDVRFRALFNLGLSQLRRGLAAPGDSARGALDAALVAYKQALLMRPADGDAKWNYELALEKKRQGGGGGGGGGNNDENEAPEPEPRPQPPTPRPSGALTPQQAEQLLNSAASDEKAVQAKHQPRGQATPPPGTRDW